MEHCEKRERIQRYKAQHPKATIRAIQKACGISSPSLVAYHLKRLAYAKTPTAEMIKENVRLRRRVAQLERRLARIVSAARE